MGQMSPKQAAVGIYQESYGPKGSTGSFGGDNTYGTLSKPAALTGKLIVSCHFGDKSLYKGLFTRVIFCVIFGVVCSFDRCK